MKSSTLIQFGKPTQPVTPGTDRFAIDGHKVTYHPRRISQWLNASDGGT